ncbi:MAG: FAD:protein FMN transferase [Pseudomonadota bacterium]
MRLLILMFALLGLAACEDKAVILTLSGETMGTTYNITAVDPGGEIDSAALAAAVDATLAAVNAAMSNWDPNSEVSRFNAQQSAEAFAISGEFAAVMVVANDVHLASGGLFDVTLGPLIELWGFGARTPESPVPSTAAITQARGSVGQDRLLSLSMDPPSLTKSRPETQVYLAAIAKGHGADRVAATLESFGLKDYLVEIGGDLVTSGLSPDGTKWRIGVERPDAVSGTVEEIVETSGLGFATSGDYRNYFEVDGERFSHIIDARTGRPITHTTASVTVLAESAMLADAWATALLALGEERGLALSEKRDLAVLFISRDSGLGTDGFRVTKSSRFEALGAEDS